MTAAPVTTDRQLLRAILEKPEDDAPRLIYADWLEEDGQPERAEFIRVQCELARCPSEIRADRRWNDLRYMVQKPWDALRRRERELWMQRRWSHLPSNLQPSFSVHIEQILPHELRGATIAIVRRGFVASVRCTTAAFVGGACERCRGSGRMEKNGSDYRCGDCHGSGRVEGIAAELFARQPVTSVTLTDREPEERSHNPLPWLWYHEDVLRAHPAANRDRERMFIPDAIFNLLDEDRNQFGAICFPTRDAALAALSRACCQYGRQLADLPPL